MSLVLLFKLLHVLIAIWFVAGLIGRGVALLHAERVDEVKVTRALVDVAGRFEQWMVIPGSLAVVVAGLATMWAMGLPLLGPGAGWLSAALALVLAISLLVPTVVLPRGRRFEQALEAGCAVGVVTPELRAAFRDPVVVAARTFELVAVAIVLVLMITKPF